MSFRAANALLAGSILIAPSVHAFVEPGDPAPMFLSVSETMQSVDMSDFIDGTPMVFLYGSAT